MENHRCCYRIIMLGHKILPPSQIVAEGVSNSIKKLNRQVVSLL
ncbi:hypothetical protein SETIT_2G420500v2 [Setaria italica]|uniref:Uncharacterized protein n=1 Tax=Setaria italica TaxID=4555 RepID=A0A368Q974_SETIT|nr:hypothetical protein SETIT_2G420500v2 [Setaria italica]